MWRAPQQSPCDVGVLTFSPKSKAALRREFERNARRKAEAERKERLRKMAAAGLLPTQIDSKEGVVLGYAFKSEKERQMAARKAQRLAMRQAAAAKSMLSRSQPPPVSKLPPSTRRRSKTAGRGGRARESPGGHPKPWNSSPNGSGSAGAEQAQQDAAMAFREIRHIEERNQRIKAALRARAAAIEPTARRRPASVPVLRSVEPDGDPFPGPGQIRGLGLLEDESGTDDDEDDPLPPLTPRTGENGSAAHEGAESMRPSTAPELLNGSIASSIAGSAAECFFNNMYDLESAMGSERHAQAREARPSTPYLDSVTTEESAAGLHSGEWNSFWAESAFDEGEQRLDTASASVTDDASQGNLMETGFGSLFKLAGSGVNDLMIAGIAAQVARTVEMDTEQALLVDLSSNCLTERRLEALTDVVVAKSSITGLNLADNRIKTKGGNVLSTVLGAGNMVQFTLSGNDIANRGLIDLCLGLKAAYKLRSLELSRCAIGATGGRALAEALDYLPNLTELDLAWNNLGTSGSGQFRSGEGELVTTTALLTALGGHHRLACLNLAWNSLGDEQIHRFTDEIIRNCLTGQLRPNLRHLDLTSNNLTGRAIAPPNYNVETRRQLSTAGNLDDTSLADVVMFCEHMKVLVVSKNSDIGFAGCRPFFSLLQHREIDEVALAPAKHPPDFNISELPCQRIVYASHCGVDNISSRPLTHKSGASGVGIAEDLAQLLATGLSGWTAGGDVLAPTPWLKDTPQSAVAAHEAELQSAKLAQRELQKENRRVAAVAARAKAQAIEENAARLRAEQERREADLAAAAAQKQWDDVEKTRHNLADAQRQLAAAIETDDTASIDAAQDLVLLLQKHLDADESEAVATAILAEKEEKEAVVAEIAVRERAEAEAAQHRTADLAIGVRLTDESAGLEPSDAQRERNLVPRRKGGVEQQENQPQPSLHRQSRPSSSGSTAEHGAVLATATSKTVDAYPPSAKNQEKLVCFMWRMSRRHSSVTAKIFASQPDGVGKIFARSVRRQVVRNAIRPKGLMEQCKSLQLPLRASTADSNSFGVIGSISSDPLDPRVTYKTKGLSFADPSLTSIQTVRRPVGLAAHQLYDSTATDVARRRNYGTLLARRHIRAVDRATTN